MDSIRCLLPFTVDFLDHSLSLSLRLPNHTAPGATNRSAVLAPSCSFIKESQALHQGVDVVVATPFRLILHLAKALRSMSCGASEPWCRCHGVLRVGWVCCGTSRLNQKPHHRFLFLKGASYGSRIPDTWRKAHLELNDVRHVVLDEADTLCDTFYQKEASKLLCLGF